MKVTPSTSIRSDSRLKRLTPALILSLAIFSLLRAPVQVQAAAPAPDKSTAKFKIDYMDDNMIDHHHMAVMKAEMCLGKAVHQELEGLCEACTVIRCWRT